MCRPFFAPPHTSVGARSPATAVRQVPHWAQAYRNRGQARSYSAVFSSFVTGIDAMSGLF